jgi:hypothetical protein
MLKMASSEEIWQPSIAVLPFLCSLYCLQEDCAAIMARLDSKETRLDLGWSIWNVPNHAKPFLHVSALICSLHDSQLCTCDQARRVVSYCMDMYGPWLLQSSAHRPWLQGWNHWMGVGEPRNRETSWNRFLFAWLKVCKCTEIHHDQRSFIFIQFYTFGMNLITVSQSLWCLADLSFELLSLKVSSTLSLVATPKGVNSRHVRHVRHVVHPKVGSCCALGPFERWHSDCAESLWRCRAPFVQQLGRSILHSGWRHAVVVSWSNIIEINWRSNFEPPVSWILEPISPSEVCCWMNWHRRL